MFVVRGHKTQNRNAFLHDTDSHPALPPQVPGVMAHTERGTKYYWLKMVRQAVRGTHLTCYWLPVLSPPFSNDFHISSESYGGHYMPQLAEEILKKNDKVKEDGSAPVINFSGFLVGNPYTDARSNQVCIHVRVWCGVCSLHSFVVCGCCVFWPVKWFDVFFLFLLGGNNGATSELFSRGDEASGADNRPISRRSRRVGFVLNFWLYPPTARLLETRSSAVGMYFLCVCGVCVCVFFMSPIFCYSPYCCC